MSLTPGSRIGPYEIGAQIGVGGMGEVYRATDTNLSRHVAVKVLPASMAADAERLARFDREAKTLAALSHPNIATIYGLERSDGQTALIMELVEGPTLAERIAEGPIPPDEALAIAKQMAEALEAAHEQGVIHRDLKPANVKVSPDGTVKVLDFGLAKTVEPSGVRSLSLSQSPTITTPAATMQGVILGTAAYMSPEQARGKLVDKRVDIWAFGCVVFEMVTGRRAFEGDDVTDTLASVVKMQPDLGRVPPRLRLLVERCLEKEPRKRLREIGDWTLLLGEGAGGPPSVEEATPSPTQWLWLVAVAVLIVTTAIVAWAPWRVDPTRVQTRLQTFPAGPDPTLVTGFDVSPDGRSVVIGAGHQLWLWPLDSLDARPLPGTEGARQAFWSLDSRSLAFVADGALRRIDVAGGSPQTILGRGPTNTVAAGARGAWNTNGIIVFQNTDGGLSRVAARGGEVTPLVKPAMKAGHLDLPVFLPDGIHFLYLDHTAGDERTRGVYVASIDARPEEQPTTPLLSADNGPLLVHDPRLDYAQVLFSRQGELLAQPFDTEAVKPVGDAIPIASGVAGAGGEGWVSSSANGDVLLYLPDSNEESRTRTLVWVDRKGVEDPINNVPPRQYVYAQLSPDGTRVALDIRGENQDIWVWNFTREALQRLTFAPERDGSPVWSSDGQRIAFVRGNQIAAEHVMWQPADGSGIPQMLVGPSTNKNPYPPTSFSPDGRALLYGAGDVWMVPLKGRTPDAALPLLTTPANERNAVVSPDGRWLAYESDESGQVEVQVRPFPDVKSGHWQISTGGGTHPLWSRDGTELFYYASRTPSALMTVRVEIGSPGGFVFGRPERLFETIYPEVQRNNQTYDVSLDGKRFLMIKDQAPARLVVVQHWFDGLKGHVVTK